MTYRYRESGMPPWLSSCSGLLMPTASASSVICTAARWSRSQRHGSLLTRWPHIDRGCRTGIYVDWNTRTTKRHCCCSLLVGANELAAVGKLSICCAASLQVQRRPVRRLHLRAAENRASRSKKYEAHRRSVHGFLGVSAFLGRVLFVNEKIMREDQDLSIGVERWIMRTTAPVQ
jgi:hypothetical protein